MVDKSEAIRLAEWAEWFLRNVNDPEDFRWKHMVESATELRRLHRENQELLEALKALQNSLDYEELLHDDQRAAYCKALELIEKQEN